MAYDLTMVGSPTYNSSGKYGQSLNGWYGRVTGAIPTSGSFTICGWVKTTHSGSIEVAFGSGDCAWVGVASDGTALAHYGHTSDVALTTSVTINDGAWHHCELVCTATSGQFFVDGVSAATASITTDKIFTSDFGVRVFVFNNNGSVGFAWSGEVDDVAIFSSVRHSATFTPALISNSEANLIAVYHLDGDGLNSASGGSSPPTTATLTGPSSGVTGVASTNFTITLDNPATGTITFTPAATVGSSTFSPSSPQITAGNSSVTFTVTPATDGTHVVSITNDGGLTNSGTVSYVTVTKKYNRVDATDGLTGENIMIMVPNTHSANPYNSAVPTGVIIYCHGVSADQTDLDVDTLKNPTAVALVDAGYIIAASNAFGDSFGSQQSVDAYAALEHYVRANYNVSNVAIWSLSMGGLTGLNVLSQNKIKGPIGWLGTSVLCSLAAANSGSGGTNFSSSINTAYSISGSGISTYANKTYGHDPLLHIPLAFHNVPMRFYASASDSVVGKTQNTDAFQALIASSCRENTVVACSGAHMDPDQFRPSDYVSFFNRCFATPVQTTGIAGVGLTAVSVGRAI